MTYIAGVRDVIAVSADRDGLTGSERAVSPAQDKGNKYVDASQYELYRSIVGSGGRGHAPLIAFGQALPKACPPGEDCEKSIAQIMKKLVEESVTERPVHEMRVMPLDENPYDKSRVEKLVNDLKGEGEWTAVHAAWALRDIGPDAKDAVPALIDAMEKYGDLQIAAAEALWRISGDTERVVPILVNALEREDLEIWVFAFRILGEIGPPAKAAVPVLIQKLKGFHSTSAAEALRKIRAGKK